MTRLIRAALGDDSSGYRLSWKTVVDGLKVTPQNPTLLDGRDAILRALDDLLTVNRIPADVDRRAMAAIGGPSRLSAWGPGAPAPMPTSTELSRTPAFLPISSPETGPEQPGLAVPPDAEPGPEVAGLAFAIGLAKITLARWRVCRRASTHAQAWRDSLRARRSRSLLGYSVRDAPMVANGSIAQSHP